MQSFLQFLHKSMDQVQPVIQWLRAWVESLLAGPDRWIAYVAAGWIALLLIAIPLFRFSGRRRRRTEAFEEVQSYSVLGIGPSARLSHSEMDDVIRPAQNYSRWAETAPMANRTGSAAVSNVTPIRRRSMAVKCTHCGEALSAGQDFCPACGYAQPVSHSVTA